MKKPDQSKTAPLCPSAQPEMADAVVFAVAGGTPEERRAVYLEQPLPATDDVLALAAPVRPTEVFRMAAPCAGLGCKHFDGSNCRLAQRIVERMAPAADQLPPCAIRPNCRWWRQEGKAACLRCPRIVTETAAASDFYRWVVDPPADADPGQEATPALPPSASP